MCAQAEIYLRGWRSQTRMRQQAAARIHSYRVAQHVKSLFDHMLHQRTALTRTKFQMP